MERDGLGLRADERGFTVGDKLERYFVLGRTRGHRNHEPRGASGRSRYEWSNNYSYEVYVRYVAETTKYYKKFWKEE